MQIVNNVCGAQIRTLFTTKNLSNFKKKLRYKILLLRKNRHLIQSDMANYKLSTRQHQREQQDPTAIYLHWQLIKIAKAHNLDVNELLDVD